MADYTITAANVRFSANAKRRRGVAGAAITTGQWVYQDLTDGKKLKLADAEADATSIVYGMAAQTVATGQEVEVVYEDPSCTPGGTVAEGDILILSGTAGAACPAGDATAGDRVVLVGIGLAGNKVDLKIHNPSAIAEIPA